MTTAVSPIPLSSSPFFRRIVTTTALLAIVFTAITIGTHHQPGTSFGWLSLLPTALVLVFALVTRRTAEALFFGTLIGLLMIDPNNFIVNAVDVSITVMIDETIAWLILVCGLMGGLIAIMEKAGSILSFSETLVKRVKTKRQSMILTFVLGLLVFIDDYLNAIAISSSMKRITDKYRVSREKLAYLVDSTAAPICVLLPISTWAIFFASLLEANNIAEAGQGIVTYMEAIPYMAYGWITLVLVALVASQKIPDLGPMKAAELRAKNGQPQPDGVEDIDFGGNGGAHPSAIMGVLNFVLPMVVLVGTSWYYGIDLLAGVFVAILFTIVFYGLQELMPVNSMFDSIYDGIKVMLLPLAIVIAGFAIKNVNSQIGLTEYVIETVAPHLSPALFPAIIFVLMTTLVFVTASSWGLFVVAMPIVLPIAEQLGVSMPLAIGALISASAAGSHSCFFSDSTVLSAQGSGCTAMQHATTQIPYAMIGIVATTVFFLVVG